MPPMRPARLLTLALCASSFLASTRALAIPPRPRDLLEPKKGIVDVKVRRIEEVKPADTTAPPPAVALQGKHRLLVVLVETRDVPWPSGFEASRYHEMIFDKQSASMREFYRENSYGVFDLDGAVVGPVRIDGKMSDYAYDRTDPRGDKVRGLVEKAVLAAAKEVKLADFDTHDTRGRKGKDGILDHLILVYAESTGRFDGFAPIWPHRGSVDLDAGGTRVSSYIVLNHAARLGVFVHEFGHDIGIPDLYDRDYSSYGAGDWCTMASGSWAGDSERPVHFSAWAKIRLGWITPRIVAKPEQNLRIPSASERPFALKIPIGEIDAREYFLIENRRKVGFDALLPAEGLIVWHIDESKGDNDDEGHKMVDVVEATKDQDLDRIDPSQAPKYGPDVFTGGGKNVFDDGSEPSARSSSGEPSGIRVKVLTPAERVMSVDIFRPEIFNPGGVPFQLAEDGYTFGRFGMVPIGKGSEALMRLEATPGGYRAFAIEAFIAGNPGSQGKLTARLYADNKGKPGKVLAKESARVKIGNENYAWLRARIGGSGPNARGISLAANQDIWVGVETDEGDVYPALNPFSTSKRARFRYKVKDTNLVDAFNFKEGKTPVSDYVIRVAGFGYLSGSDRPEELANDGDELVKRLRRADALADKNAFADALAEYEAILAAMEKEPRRYDSWIPVAINSAGVMAYELKRYDVALERFESTLRRAIAAKDDPNTADVYENLGETSFYAGKLPEARTYCDRSRELNERLSRLDRLVENLYWGGRARQEAGETEAADQHYVLALDAVKRAFAKDAKSEAEWNQRIARARAGKPEDKPSVAERADTMNDESTKKKQKATYTDLLQFLEDDIAEE